MSELPGGWPLRFVDAGLLGLILLLPFIWGGRQALGNFAVVLMSGWTALWWSIHQLRQDRPRWRLTGAEPLFLLAILLVGLQTFSIPESVKDRLSPHIDKMLVGWGTDPETSLGLGTWNTLSFVPWQTWSNLISVIAVIMVFFVAVQRLQTAKDIHQIFRYIALSGCTTAVFGLLQYVFSNGKFLWFYEHPDTNSSEAAKGLFTNANHFANYLAMCLPAQLWWQVTASRSINKRREARDLNNPAPTGWRAVVEEWSAALMLAFTVVAIILSQSRGGLLVTGVALSMASLLFWKQRLFDSRIALWFLGITFLGVVAVLTFGGQLERKLTADLESISTGEVHRIDREGARRKIWETDLLVVRDFPIVGTGLGSHRYVYESYHNYPADGTEYTHAENGYLQIAMETGITGLTIIVLLISLVGYWCLKGLIQASQVDVQAPLTVAATILTVNLVHSFTDFIWYVPSCMVIVMLTAACACILHRLSSPVTVRASSDSIGLGRGSWAMMLILVLAGLGWSVQVKWPEVAAEPHFHQYKRLAGSKDTGDGMTTTSFEIESILKAAQANPHDPILQARAGRAQMRHFLLKHHKQHDLRMEDIRQAAISSEYKSRQELNAWLDNPDVMGENRRLLNRAQSAYLRALRLCPLETRPYIETARLAWLSLGTPEIENRLMQQALRVRPYDGQVWMEYAHALNNRGELEEAIPCYQRSFKLDSRCRKAIITDLAPHFPPGFFLDSFELDRSSLANLKQAYEGTSDTRGYHKLLQLFAEAELAESMQSEGELSAGYIVSAHRCYAEIGELELATSTLQKAVKRHGNSYHLRLNLANWLFDQGQYSTALPHLEWCHRRRPDVDAVKKRIQIALTQSDATTQLAEEVDSHSRYR